MSFINNKILEYFGEKLIQDVRDETISNWDMILEGKMKDITAQLVREKTMCFNDEQIEVLKWLIPKVIDMNLHNLLTMITQNDDIKIKVCDDENDIDIEEISDGLEGELYTEDGWIMKFSNKRYEE